MRKVISAAGTLLVLASTALMASDARPTPVSPGNLAGIAMVEARCPSFSWGGTDGADGYEIRIYEIGKDGEALPIVEHRVPGSALSWTPDLGRCLAPGGRYAWSIRALTDDRDDDPAWSEPRLFTVAAGPTRSEFEEALALVRRYLGTERTAGAQTENEARAEEGVAPRESARAASAPVPAAVGATEMTVDGRIVATSFQGDGSELTALSADNITPGGTADISILGSAASATDADTLDGIDSTAFLQSTALDTEADLETLLTDVTNVLTDSETAASATALAADPPPCPPGQVVTDVAANGTLTCAPDAAGIDHGIGAGNVRVGPTALSNPTGNSNTAIGEQALREITTGSSNAAIGEQALRNNTSGNFNTGMGRFTLQKNQGGARNTATGASALYTNVSGSYNTASGFEALHNSTGSRNTAVGNKSGYNLTTGSDNVHIANEGVAGEGATLKIGTQGIQTKAYVAGISGTALTGSNVVVSASGQLGVASGATGNANQVDGFDASATATANTLLALNSSAELPADITGNAVTATSATSSTSATMLASNPSDCLAGEFATAIDASGNLTCATDGGIDHGDPLSNTAVGTGALVSNTTGSGNAALGYSALYYNYEGTGNVAVGYRALSYNFYGNRNVALGYLAMQNNYDGSDNVSVGSQALTSNSSGYENVAIGPRALQSNQTGNRNIGIGQGALKANTASYNTATGHQALYGNDSGSGNTATGYQALYGNTIGSGNTATGYQALSSGSGNYNTAVGRRSLQSATGNFNTGVGINALRNTSSGSSNTAIGENAGLNATTGSYNIFVGSGTSGSLSDTGTIRIGGSGYQTRTFIEGIRGTTTYVNDAVPVLIDSLGQLGTVSSSARYKEEIADMGSVSERLLALRPVTFKYKREFAGGEKPIQFGLIAEEVADVFPELVVYNEEGQPQTVKYHLLATLLLNELQKQAVATEALAHRSASQDEKLTELAALRRRIAELETLEARLAELEALTPKVPRVAVLPDRTSSRARSSPAPSSR